MCSTIIMNMFIYKIYKTEIKLNDKKKLYFE